MRANGRRGPRGGGPAPSPAGTLSSRTRSVIAIAMTPSLNASTRFVGVRRPTSRPPVGSGGAARSSRPLDDRRPEGAESVDPEDDLVARLRGSGPSVASLTSSRQPVPTVPDPSRSPGRSRASADARATIAPNENWASGPAPARRLDAVHLGGHGRDPARSRPAPGAGPARRGSRATARSTTRSPCPWRARAGRPSPRAGGRGPTSR